MSNSKFVAINGHKIHYLEEGEGDVILFIHGILTSSYSWHKVIPLLSKKARCIAPDLIGMGKSDKPKTQYGVMEQLRDITTFIEQLKLTNITLVLHGLGYIVGLHYAMHNPDNIKGIAFYEPEMHTLSNADNRSLPIQELMHLFQQESDYGYKKIVEDNFLIDKLLPGIAFDKLGAETKKAYQKSFRNLEDRKTLWHLFKELYLHTNHKLDENIGKYSEFLQRSSLPKLLFYSTPGFNTSIATIAWCRDNLPNIKLADLEEGLHLAPETDPNLFGTILLDWYENYASVAFP